jgi:FAD/FMN-containing dehydrogenases
VPEFTLLITIDPHTTEHSANEIVETIRTEQQVRIKPVNSPHKKDMFWHIRRASYTLSKLQDESKRPAAFLEDMTVPPEHISEFFVEVKKLLKKHNVQAAVHGHGGNGHLHFYPLLDFTKDQGEKVEQMAEDFFNVAIKYKGNICGEHNDGIIRTPHLSKLYNKKVLGLFKDLEAIFDPKDIFNPGKKVNPRYDIKQYLRRSN